VLRFEVSRSVITEQRVFRAWFKIDNILVWCVFLNCAQNSSVITDLDKVQSACTLNTLYNPVTKPLPHSKAARTKPPQLRNGAVAFVNSVYGFFRCRLI
jgi:hypothetical protein